jgi:Gly-Xaa carboxypeptidase
MEFVGSGSHKSVMTHRHTPQTHQLSRLASLMASSDEKVDFLTGAPVVRAPRSKRSKWTALGLVALLATVFAVAFLHADFLYGKFLSATSLTHTVAKLCPQSDALYPENNAQLWDSLGSDFDEDAFTTRAAAWLGGAVRIPTEAYDDMGPVGEDERWEAFVPFHAYLVQSFPLIHKSLTLTKVNTYGLLYEWKGSDDSLKPLLLAAHQDVVPVEPETVDQWDYPPYSGYYDGKSIWGRGSSDDKSGLIGILASIETLLEKGFEPARTIVLASGFDEEISGAQGARHLSDAMLKKYGKDSFALLVDEGGIFLDIEGSVIAIPGIAEKGKLDTKVKVMTAGGHSSIPPAHTVSRNVFMDLI